jgi:phosphoglucomutase
MAPLPPTDTISWTEDVYKLYAESFTGSDHLRHIQEEALAIVQQALT